MTAMQEIINLIDEEKANEIATKFGDIIDGASFMTVLASVAFIVSKLNELSPTPKNIKLTLTVLNGLVLSTETEDFVVN